MAKYTRRRQRKQKGGAKTPVTFDDARALTIQYLSGEGFKVRENATTSQDAVPQLREINRLGLLTKDSQIGVMASGVYNGKPYVSHERAYVTGIMKRRDCVNFIARMNAYTDKIAFAHKITPPKSPESPGTRIAVTVEGDTADNLEQFTSIATEMSKDVFDFEMNMEFVDDDELDAMHYYIRDGAGLCMVACIDPKYGRLSTDPEEGLLNAIIRALNNI